MASAVATAIRTEQAFTRLMHAATLLSERANVPALELPMQGKDPVVLRALQLEAMARWLEAVATAPPDEDEQNGSTKTTVRQKRMGAKPTGHRRSTPHVR